MSDEYVTPAQAGVLLNLSADTVRHRVERGTLKLTRYYVAGASARPRYNFKLVDVQRIVETMK